MTKRTKESNKSIDIGVTQMYDHGASPKLQRSFEEEKAYDGDEDEWNDVDDDNYSSWGDDEEFDHSWEEEVNTEKFNTVRT